MINPLAARLRLLGASANSARSSPSCREAYSLIGVRLRNTRTVRPSLEILVLAVEIVNTAQGRYFSVELIRNTGTFLLKLFLTYDGCPVIMLL